jgi:hypothetical protein
MDELKNEISMEVIDQDGADQKIGAGSRGRQSRYEPVAQKWAETDDDEALILDGLEEHDVQNLRNLLYRRFGKENVIVRSAQQGEDEGYKAVIRKREGGEYLRD